MTIYYRDIQALIDPEQSDPLPDGGRLQDVSVILTDHPGGGKDAAAARRGHAVALPSARPGVLSARARRARRPREDQAAMTVKTPQPPPLPAEVDRLLRRLRLPYIRQAAPDVLATATSQRWDPAEVLKVLLAEEAAGRDQATIRMRRRQSGLPAGKTFDA